MAVDNEIKLPKLSDKRRRFAEEYLIDFNATQAAIRAGYSPKSAAQQGSELLKNPKVRAYVDARMSELGRRTGITQERILRELARIAFLDPTKLADMDTGRMLANAIEDDRAAIASVKVKTFESADGGGGIEREIRFADKIRALELLGKRFGMWLDRTQMDVTGAVQIIDDVPRSGSDEE